MSSSSFVLSGSKESLEELRIALLADSQGSQFHITAPVEDTSTPSNEVRVRQPWELSEAIWIIVITFPIGVASAIAGNRLDDWLRGWLKGRVDAAQIRVREESAPGKKPSGESS